MSCQQQPFHLRGQRLLSNNLRFASPNTCAAFPEVAPLESPSRSGGQEVPVEDADSCRDYDVADGGRVRVRY